MKAGAVECQHQELSHVEWGYDPIANEDSGPQTTVTGSESIASFHQAELDVPDVDFRGLVYSSSDYNRPAPNSGNDESVERTRSLFVPRSVFLKTSQEAIYQANIFEEPPNTIKSSSKPLEDNLTEVTISSATVSFPGLKSFIHISRPGRSNLLISSIFLMEKLKINSLSQTVCWFHDPCPSVSDYELVTELLYWRLGDPIWDHKHARLKSRPNKCYLSRVKIYVNNDPDNDNGFTSPIQKELLPDHEPLSTVAALRSIGFSPVSNFSSPTGSFVTAYSPPSFIGNCSPASFMTAPSIRNSPASFITAPSIYGSPASFITAPSICNSPAFTDGAQIKFDTIMEVDELPPVPPTVFETLGMDYQAELQTRELIQSLDKELNWSGKGQHVVFKPKEEVPLEFISHLGASATARVDMVRCRRVALARKTMRCKGSWSRNNVLQEVSHLQELRHPHIVQLVGSYLQGRDFSLLMYPAATCHLGAFLEDTEDLQNDQVRQAEYVTRRRFPNSALQCLASAVECVHQLSRKHMDIKPQNVLVKQIKERDELPWSVYLADFGLSRSFANQGHSQTDGPTSMTPKYCAPEVYEYELRDRSSDIFSLGCVYVEMMTVIAQKSLHKFAEIRRDEDGDASFHKNLDKVQGWVENLSTVPQRCDNPLTISLQTSP